MATSTEERRPILSLLRCAAGTDVGMRREENQDSFGIIKHAGFQGFFIADGMGGARGGAIASRLAISTLEQSLPSSGGSVTTDSLREIVTQINTRIFEQGTAQPELAGMGTTLVGLLFLDSALISVNVGDSRAYRIRGDSIMQISEDHTLVRELLRSGAISATEADGHPVSHMLTRSLGPLAEVDVECHIQSEAPEEGDVYVLCSDGLYNLVNDKEILNVVRQNPLDDANQILINLANRRGGPDNITVLVISVGEPSGRSRGSDYRKARDTSRATGASIHHDRETEEPREEAPHDGQPTNLSSQRRRGETDGEAEAVTPPKVEEPKDHYAERESLKEKKLSIRPPSQGIPVSVMIVGAVIFGLVVGDVAKRWTSVPDLLSLFRFGSRTERGPEFERAGRLVDLSKELEVSGASREPGEGLPDIARRVREELSGARGEREGRSEILSLNRTALESAATKLEAQLATLNGAGDAGASSEKLQRAREQVTGFQRELKAVETQIDATSRKLSLWFGRKKRLEDERPDMFNPSGDVERVGAVSDVVKRKVAEWTEATYRLQGKQDEYELYPSDDALRREVEVLKDARERLTREIRTEVQDAIDGVLAATYKQLEELKAKRDIVAGQLSSAQEEVDFFKIVAEPESGAKNAFRKRVEQELTEVRAALRESNDSDS